MPEKDKNKKKVALKLQIECQRRKQNEAVKELPPSAPLCKKRSPSQCPLLFYQW